MWTWLPILAALFLLADIDVYVFSHHHMPRSAISCFPREVLSASCLVIDILNILRSARGATIEYNERMTTASL